MRAVCAFGFLLLSLVNFLLGKRESLRNRKRQIHRKWRKANGESNRTEGVASTGGTKQVVGHYS